MKALFYSIMLLAGVALISCEKNNVSPATEVTSRTIVYTANPANWVKTDKNDDGTATQPRYTTSFDLPEFTGSTFDTDNITVTMSRSKDMLEGLPSVFNSVAFSYSVYKSGKANLIIDCQRTDGKNEYPPVIDYPIYFKVVITPSVRID